MLIAPPAQKQDDGPRRHEDPGGMSGKPAYRRLHSCINRAPPQAVGGAISSRARPLASGPIWVTATAAIATITAITTNTAVRPKPCWIHRKDGIATKAPTRPADWQSPNPEARALVGNTSEMKICEEFPANWMKKIIPNPIASTIPSLAALAQSSPNTAVRRKAVTAVGLRPKRSSEYIMKGAGTREGEGYPKDRVQRFGDRETSLDENVRQPGAEPERDAEEGEKADHPGEHAARVFAQDNAERVALGIARRAGPQRRER